MILYRSRPRAKPTRVSKRPPAPFAAGLFTPVPPLPSAPAMPRRIRWAALDLTPLGEEDSDRHYDRLAAESAGLDRYEAGLISYAVAEELSRTSLVGHRP